MEIEWTGAAIDPPVGAEPPDPESWQPVEVPGRPAALAGAEAAVYRGRFPDPREHDRQRALLSIRGVYGTATVWLDGRRVGEGGRVAPIRVPFDPEPENELVIAVVAPDRFGGIEADDRSPTAATAPSIRWGVDVEPVPDPTILGLSARPRPGDEPAIDVTATVATTDPLDDYVTLSLRPEGFRAGGAMERARVTAGPGERTTVEATLSVRDGRQWFPRELGPQDRYTVRAKLGDATRTVTTGLIEVEREGGDLLLNGRRHRPRGVIAPPTADPEAIVERALDANATLVRARSHVPSPALLDACDEAGLLVWQDLPLTGPGEFDPEAGSDLASALAHERGHHPSLVCYGVHDEPVRPYGGLGDGFLDRLRFRWRARRAEYDRTGAEAVAGSLPAEAAIFPVVGPPGIDADATTLYPGWEYLSADAVEWLLGRYDCGVVGAFGAGSRRADGPVPALTAAADPIDDPDESRAAQARTVRTVAETLRRRGVGTVVLDALLDGAPEGGMGVLTDDGSEKPAFGALADAFEPVQAVLDGSPTKGTVGVTVCNDTATERSGTLEWSAGDRTGSTDVSVDAFGRADAGAVNVPGDADHVSLELVLEEGTVTNDYDASLYR